MEEQQEELPLYVSDPVINKEGIGGITTYVSYSLKGSKLQNPLNRRYRDFDALRRKLIERWPGVFIPKLPHKKKIGNKQKEVVEIRIEMINRFLKKLCNIDYLYGSDEVELFLQESSNVPKTLDNIKENTYEELLKKYASVFTDYDDNFDTLAGKKDQESFRLKLGQNYPRLKAFRKVVYQEKIRFQDVQKNYLAILNLITLYEKDVLLNYTGDEEKLVFMNSKNVDLLKNMANTQEKVINPYDRLYAAITEDYLTTEAMIEALDGLKGLQETYNKLTRNLTSTNVQLNDLQAGKTNIKILFKFKGKEENINNLMIQKEKLERDIEHLGQIIKIVTFNMQKEIQNFQTTSLDNYYAQLARVEEDTETNSSIFDELWDTVVRDKNISEYN
jgi:hypothetical protein